MNIKSKSAVRISASRMKKEEFYPYIAHINGDCLPVDLMFGAVLFDFTKTQPKFSDWENMIYSLFRSGENLRALDSAVADVKELLQLPEDYKLKILVSPPVPQISRDYFGDINGDGISEKLLDSEDCVRAVLWFADNLNRRFKACGFKHIEISGWLIGKDSTELFSAMVQKGYECISDADCAVFDISDLDEARSQENLCIFAEPEEKLLLSCALSQDGAQRKIYDDLYDFLRGGREETDVEISESAVISDDMCDITEDEYFPGIFGDFTEETSEDISEELPETFVEPEKTQENEESEELQAVNKSACEPEYQTEIPQSIVLDIDISTSQCPLNAHGFHVPPPPPPPEHRKRACLDNKKKIALFGAGVAAVLGIAYLIGRSGRD